MRRSSPSHTTRSACTSDASATATWLAAKKVGRYQMCKLMGWAMSSDMPDHYIDRAGVVEAETIAAIRGDDLTHAERENQALRTTLQRLQAETRTLQEQMNRRDDFLDRLFRDDRLVEVVALAIRTRNLGTVLRNI